MLFLIYVCNYIRAIMKVYVVVVERNIKVIPNLQAAEGVTAGKTNKHPRCLKIKYATSVIISNI